MINFVTAAGHGSTLRHLMPSLGVPARRWSYERLVRRSRLPRGTWIFTDHERLSPFEISVAAELAECLRRAGCRILNHPARVLTRFALLDALHAAGINDHRAFRADENPAPTRFPVFIRREFDHRGNDRVLLRDRSELDAALSGLRAAGVPLVGNLVVEYSGEEASPGIWYRGSAYRAGDDIIAHHMALDDKWLVKDGFDAGRLRSFDHREAFLARERAFVGDNEHAQLLRRVFDIAGLEYGRADFGFVDNRLQIYEINTNPNHASEEAVFGNIHPDREESQRSSERRLREAIANLDTAPDGSVTLTGPLLERQQQILPIRQPAMRRS